MIENDRLATIEIHCDNVQLNAAGGLQLREGHRSRIGDSRIRITRLRPKKVLKPLTQLGDGEERLPCERQPPPPEACPHALKAGRSSAIEFVDGKSGSDERRRDRSG